MFSLPKVGYGYLIFMVLRELPIEIKKKKKSTVNMPGKRCNTQTTLQHDSAVSCVLILVSTTHLSLQRASCHSLLPQPGKGQDAENH